MTRNSVASIDAEIAALKNKRHSLRGKQLWKCTLCQRGTQLRNLHLVIIKYYVRPYGCTGGDYWTAGERPEYMIECVKCGEAIREIDSDGSGVGFYGQRASFSTKRWQLIHSNHDAFASIEYVCKQ
jgi:hypothetical protein